MSKSSVRSVIRLRGVRHNNLKNFDLDLPLNQLIVITGLSGSGKSSLAFDTLFAEGQRRYIETFSPYARQFFDRMDKPQVDSIEGIPPAIAIEQRNAVRTTRSTVGTMTEICDYMKVLWGHLAELHCRGCGKPVRQDTPQRIWTDLASVPSSEQRDALVVFDVPLTDKLPLNECLGLIAKQGYQRLLLNNEVVRLDDLSASDRRFKPLPAAVAVIQDRVKLAAANRARFVEACEQAYHFGKGKLTVHLLAPSREFAIERSLRFSSGFHCAACDIDYREPTPALFSFNHPLGACPACKGFGRVISIDYNLAIPDRSRTIAEGVVKPWLTGHGLESQRDLLRACRHHGIPTDVPFEKLPKKWQDFVIEGEPDYGIDEEHEWPRAWYGVKGYFRWLESRSYKMHVRVLLSRYRAYTTCQACTGTRFQPEALLYRAHLEGTPNPITLADFYALPVRDAYRWIDCLASAQDPRPDNPVTLALSEVRARLGFLNQVGLGYLTLDRPTRSLSGGETERVNLTTCLGTRLVNTLFVLDEPSVGLHPRDTERLVRILQQLRDAGNTVVVVEHEAGVMRAADRIIDLGPGHGATGGELVFEGTYAQILKSETSLTGQYLSGRKRVEPRPRRPVRLGRKQDQQANGGHTAALNEAVSPFRTSETNGACPVLRIRHANAHNLRDVSVNIPLQRFVCVTGVSGSGKTTLVREVLLPALTARLQSRLAELRHPVKASDRFDLDTDNDDSPGERTSGPAGVEIEGAEHLSRVVLVDQSILGKTPRSNPAVYIGAFDDIREFFAQSPAARQRGLNASAFSFNSAQGQCERCRGAGFEKIEMQFLSDVFIRCPDCDGRRFRPHILEVKVDAGGDGDLAQRDRARKRSTSDTRRRQWSIADVLEATAEEALRRKR